jgi:type I restriction enzyme M protein
MVKAPKKSSRKKLKFSGDKFDQLLQHLDCTAENLPDFGYYPTYKKGEYLTYETKTDLRDSESVLLNDSIHRYFLAEVKPHVA